MSFINKAFGARALNAVNPAPSLLFLRDSIRAGKAAVARDLRAIIRPGKPVGTPEERFQRMGISEQEMPTVLRNLKMQIGIGLAAILYSAYIAITSLSTVWPVLVMIVAGIQILKWWYMLWCVDGRAVRSFREFMRGGLGDE
jgi:hypothetical protein